MEQTLQGRIAVVTGGGRGIGRAVCEALAARGAHVVINYSRSKSAAEEVQKVIEAQDGKAELCQFDVSDSAAVDSAMKGLLSAHGKIDILVNNAGIAVDSLLVRTKDEDWNNTIAVNLSGSFYCSRAVAKGMMKARYGRIINISSVIGEIGNAGQAAYSASKAGIIGLTKSLAKELASRGVTVNAVTPGYIVTDMTGQLDEATTELIKNQIPLSRLGEPGDIAESVAFLASEGAGYITGQVLGVNGGMRM